MVNKTKYVECKHSALVRCKYVESDGKDATIEFYPFVVNKYTGGTDHTGFTAVTEEQLTLLQEHSKVFVSFVKQRLLIVRDELPISALTPQALLANKDMEIQELKSKLAIAEQRIIELSTTGKDEEIVKDKKRNRT